jgi:hypothetical protein
MMRQVEVIVAAKREQPSPVALDPDSVHTVGLDQRAAQARAFKRGKLFRRELVKRLHDA